MRELTWHLRPETVLGTAKLLIHYLEGGEQWAIDRSALTIAARMLCIGNNRKGKWRLPSWWRSRIAEIGLNENFEIIDHYKFSIAWEIMSEFHKERPHFRFRRQDFIKRLNFGPAPKNPQAQEIVTPGRIGKKKREAREAAGSLSSHAGKNGKRKATIDHARASGRMLSQRARAYLDELLED